MKITQIHFTHMSSKIQVGKECRGKGSKGKMTALNGRRWSAVHKRAATAGTKTSKTWLRCITLQPPLCGPNNRVGARAKFRKTAPRGRAGHLLCGCHRGSSAAPGERDSGAHSRRMKRLGAVTLDIFPPPPPPPWALRGGHSF